jgi:serine phosphatase RsbU (regulator of sigma subunit)
MIERLMALVDRMFPSLRTAGLQTRSSAAVELLTLAYTAPLALIGLIWLGLATDLQLIRQNAGLFALLAGLTVMFHLVQFFLIVELTGDQYGTSKDSFGGVIAWTGMLLLGPTILWLSILWNGVDFLRNRYRLRDRLAWLRGIRTLTSGLIRDSLAMLVGYLVYRQLGGQTPFASLSVGSILSGFGGLGAAGVLFLVVLIIYVLIVRSARIHIGQPVGLGRMLWFLALAVGLPMLADPFGFLAAGIYRQNGLAVFLFLIAGLFMVGLLARRLSLAVESARMQSRQLSRLERLSRAILNARPDDPQALSAILGEHMPDMFAARKTIIHLLDGRTIFRHPDTDEEDLSRVLGWLEVRDEASNPPEIQAFVDGERLPWAEQVRAFDPIVLTPILHPDTRQMIGLVYVELRTLAERWHKRSIQTIFPAMQTLADQIASGMHRTETYQEVLAYHKAAQELAIAGQIQSGFFPRDLPLLDGWELAFSLLPARETSGDYFDFISLPEDRVAILIADVADKGLGAALYMALSRTLIRTFAQEYDQQPSLVAYFTNERILQDASANLFVTAFYGVLDRRSGVLNYFNAGHNPQLLLRNNSEQRVDFLNPTGMPLGVDEDAVWRQDTVTIQAGDVLVLYTDGIPDSQTEAGELFGEERLQASALSALGSSAQEIQSIILQDIEAHVSGGAQFDDITLLVLLRN